MGVPYVPHDGPPRDVELRCEIGVTFEYDFFVRDEPVETLDGERLAAAFRDLLRTEYSIDQVSRVDEARIAGIQRNSESDLEIAILLDITLLQESESIDSLCERMSDDWEMFNDSVPLPEGWSAFVGGSCSPRPAGD